APDYAQKWMRQRWRVEGMPNLRAFAPYASHCVRVDLAHHFAFMNDLLGPRGTHQIDRLYYFYSPFANIFVSGDKIHRKFAFLLDSDQEFIWRDDLIIALREIMDLSSSQVHGTLTVPDQNLVTRIWKRCFNAHPNHHLS